MKSRVLSTGILEKNMRTGLPLKSARKANMTITKLKTAQTAKYILPEMTGFPLQAA